MTEGEQRYFLNRIINKNPLNPNGKLRLYGTAWDQRSLIAFASVRFVKNDESVYLVPAIVKPIQLEMGTAGGIIIPRKLSPGKQFYISFHPSGVINVHTAGRQVRLHQACNVDLAKPVLSFGVRTEDYFTRVKTELKQRDCAIPFSTRCDGYPVFISVFRLDPSHDLADEAFILTDCNPIEFVFSIRGRPERYLLAFWSHTQICNQDFMVYAGAPPGGIPDLRAGHVGKWAN